ncbi:glycosyltransferase family 2 protein [Mariniflexile aquimaris]|uniref:Glycosyltransferase family 2 protein n=1 Tax=Mariniflexile aquimaris TaxID=881009 RepID=A0ABW3BTW7_9FLAO
MSYRITKILKSIFPELKSFSKRVVKEENKLTLSMIVKNEADRYLREVLEHAIKYVDEVIIIDDASTDNSVQLCKEVLKNTSFKIIQNKKSLFHKEYKLRKLQWKETLKMNPDWILFLDADEIFENKILDNIKSIINNKNIDVYKFRLYDMWNETHYREDNLWCAHYKYKTFLIRYQPYFKYKFLKQDQHCGRHPKNLHLLPFENSDIKLKHLGWSNERDRILKYNRYINLDLDGRYGNAEQYKSILDTNPNLLKF